MLEDGSEGSEPCVPGGHARACVYLEWSKKAQYGCRESNEEQSGRS